jgi:hypothetical protein
VSPEGDKRSRRPSTNSENLRTHPWRLSPSRPWTRRRRWYLPRDLNWKFEPAPHCRKFVLRLLTKTNNNMVIIPHPPNLAPFDFTLFPKLKMKLKGQHFETVSDIQSESIGSDTLQHLQRMPLWCFWIVERMMELRYTFPLRLFWRKWHPKLFNLRSHLVFFFFFFFVPSLGTFWWKVVIMLLCYL